MKKGFTLIELLAVIVILAILAIIIVPKITGMVEKGKVSAFESTANGLVSAVKYDNTEDSSLKLYTTKNGEIVDENGEALDYKGEKFEEAQIIKTKEGKISLIVYKNKMCATKSFDTNKIDAHKVESKEECFGVFKVGSEVTLNDGSKWHVIKDSGNKITLMSKYNISLEDGEYFQKENNESSYMPYDTLGHRPSSTNSYCTNESHGCNAYEKNGTTVIEDSDIKTFTDNYKDYLVQNETIFTSDIVRLVNVDELIDLGCNCADKTAEGTCPNNKYPWAFNDNYWTMEPKEGSPSNVWFIYSGNISWDMAGRENYHGFKPVIELSKIELGMSSKTSIDEDEAVKAVWIWAATINDIIDNDKIDNSINLLKSNKFNELYISMNVTDLNKYAKYIEKANKNDMIVYLLVGDPGFVKQKNYNSVVNQNMDYVDLFNRTHSGDAHITGVHYDVEYYGAKNEDGEKCPTGQSEEAKSCFARRGFIELARHAKKYAEKKNLLVGYDITIYTTNLVTFYDTDGKEKNVLDELMKNADELVAMTYGDSPKNTIKSYLIKGVYSHSSGPAIDIKENYIEKLSKKGIKIVVGQEYPVFEKVAQKISENGIEYANEKYPEYQNGDTNDYAYTKEFVDRVANDIKVELTSKLEEANLKNTVGFAFHDYRYFESLYSN